jgi:hypothetical protein
LGNKVDIFLGKIQWQLQIFQRDIEPLKSPSGIRKAILQWLALRTPSLRQPLAFKSIY